MAKLPESVAKYITEELGHPLSSVAAHRHVNGEEPMYVALLSDPQETHYWLVAFVGKYTARQPLGDYEEAHAGNARLLSWDCLYDSEEWTGTVGQFMAARRDRF